MKNKIMVLGSKGMLGNAVSKYFKEQNYDVTDVYKEFVDVTNFEKLKFFIKVLQPDYVINCVGALRSRGYSDYGKLNITLPHMLDNLSQWADFKLVHVSTNCCFDDIGPHGEDEQPNTKDVYGMSKAFGEINNDHNLTIRTSLIGINGDTKFGLMDWIIYNKEQVLNGYTNAMWNGVTTLQLAKYIHSCIKYEKTGLINYYSKETVNKYNILQYVNEIFNLNKTIVAVEGTLHMSLLAGPNYTEIHVKDQIKELRDWYVRT